MQLDGFVLEQVAHGGWQFARQVMFVDKLYPWAHDKQPCILQK